MNRRPPQVEEALGATYWDTLDKMVGAVDIISQGRGEHFDPAMVDAFMDIAEEFRAIATRFADSDDDLQKKVDYLALATQATPPGTEAQDLQAIGA